MEIEWNAVLPVLLGAGVAGGVSIWATKVTLGADLKGRKEERYAIQAAQFNERFASMVGAVSVLMSRMHVDRLALNYNDETSNRFLLLKDELEALRPEIVATAVLAPDKESKARIRAMSRSLDSQAHWVGWVLSDMARERSGGSAQTGEVMRKQRQDALDGFSTTKEHLKILEEMVTGIESDVGLEPVPSPEID